MGLCIVCKYRGTDHTANCTRTNTVVCDRCSEHKFKFSKDQVYDLARLASELRIENSRLREHNSYLQEVLDDKETLPTRECKACGGSGKVIEQYQRYVDESDPNPKRVRWHSTSAECPICHGKGYVE